MSINDHQKLDVLWKKFRGVSPTSPLKGSHNERYLSESPTFQKNFWTDSDRIPIPAPEDQVFDGNELWAGVIQPHYGTTALTTAPNTTTDYSAWQALSNTVDGEEEPNFQTNFVPDTFHRSYTVRVWAGDPASNVTVIPQMLNPLVDGYEWFFDYNTGILYFPNNVPPIAKQNGIWIEGWTYIGEIGREGDSGSGSTNTSKIKTLSFVTPLLSPDQQVDFTLPTGGKCILVEAKLSAEGTLECHAMSSRDDTNPYRFKSLISHLVDDGSYVVSGNRYYGERFVPLINMEDTTSDLTYWRVINSSITPAVYTIVVKIA
jgi:hypothetical protein